MRRSKKYDYGLSTHVGAVRKTNEDSAYLNVIRDRYGNELLVTLVADGMGGYHAGDVASQLLVAKIDDWCRTRATVLLRLPYPFIRIETEMEELFHEINNELIAYSEDYGKKSGTTASILFLFRSQFLVIHIGDSRIYQLRGHGSVSREWTQLTEDHSYVMEQVRKGKMTIEEAETHPDRNLLLYGLGIDNRVEIYTNEGEYQEQDTFFLCTDGFYNIYPLRDVLTWMEWIEQRITPIQSFTDMMVEEANRKGATDNITVSMVSPKTMRSKGGS